MSKFQDFKEELRQKQTEIKEKIRSEGENHLKEIFKNLFNDFPDLECIKWRQYTPSFNDGDPCLFSIDEPSFKFASGPKDGGYHDDGFLYSWNEECKKHEKDNKLTELTNLFGDKVTESILEELYGNGKQIIVTKNKIDIEEYEDY